MHAKYFFGFIVSFIVGVAVESIFDFGHAFALLLIVTSLFVYLTQKVRSASKNVFLVSLILAGVALGTFRVDVSQGKRDTVIPESLMGVPLRVDGLLVGEPDVRENYTNVVLEANNVLYRETSYLLEKKTLVLVRVPAYPLLSYGDTVSVLGKITKPKNFAPKENEKAFDYESYLAKDDIYYQMYFPSVTVVSKEKGNFVLQKLFTFKSILMDTISQNIPEPESSLAGGITLGAKQSLGETLLQKFRETGVAHIVVLSGYNIAVVAGIISRLIIFLPFTIRLIASAVGIVLFALMVGGGATVVRATIMALIVIVARLTGREGSALRALVLAGGLMVFVNPMILLHDVSFQLSFSATLALVTLAPAIEKYFQFISNRVFREIIITTFATQIFVLPIILYHMGSVSLVGLVANIFILPVVPIAMLIVALVALFAWVPFLGSVISFLAFTLLSYIIVMVEFFSRIPFASLKGITFPLWGLYFSYTLLSLYIIKNIPSKNYSKKDNEEF